MENQVKHVAIIMDGNRRWAKERGLPPAEGHAAGVVALEKVVRSAAGLGLDFVTVYALSTENLQKREKGELQELFNLMASGFTSKLPVLKKENVRVAFFGDIKGLPFPVRKILTKTQEELQNNTGPQLNIALNYGSRAEILQAIQKLIMSGQEEVTEEIFEKSLYTSGIPDPDLVIRTGGQKRLSNFLLWQTSYSELYFTNKLWPDFSEADLKEALEDYQARKRNFGV